MVRLFTLLAVLAAAAPAGAELTQIGSAAAVSGNVQAAAPGAVGRIVQSGKPLYLNDHVTTDSKGRLQVLLADETVFTLGPDSDMVLDEFVYDPASGAGKVSANITKGAFRFVTGKVARKDPEKMKVKLSVGTIGIRGTTVVGSVDAVRRVDTVILADNGMVIVTPNQPPAPPAVTAPPQLQQPAHQQLQQTAPQQQAPPPPPPPAPVLLRSAGFGTTLSGENPVPAPPAPMQAQALAIMNSLNAPPPPGPRNAPLPGAGQAQQQGGAQEQQAGGQEQQASGQPSAGELSGQDTANLFSSALVSQDLAGLSGSTGGEIASTSQQQLEQQIQTEPTWDDLRNAGYIGSYDYQASGSYTCSGACDYDSGELSLSLLVNFNERTYGDNQGTSELRLLGNGFYTGINTASFDSLTGKAAITLNSDSGNSTDYRFDGSVIKFTNDPVLGTGMGIAVNAVYDDRNGTTASGSGTGTALPHAY